MIFDRSRDGREGLVERYAARDLLQDLGLVAGEHRGPAALRHVATHRLELDDLAVLVEERAVGPLVPVHRSVLRVLPVLLGLHFVAGPEVREPRQLGPPLRRREQVDETGAEQLGAARPKNSANGRLTNVSVVSGR